MYEHAILELRGNHTILKRMFPKLVEIHIRRPDRMVKYPCTSRYMPNHTNRHIRQRYSSRVQHTSLFALLTDYIKYQMLI